MCLHSNEGVEIFQYCWFDQNYFYVFIAKFELNFSFLHDILKCLSFTKSTVNLVMLKELDWNKGKTCMFMQISIISRDKNLRKRKKKSKTKYFKQTCSWCWRNAYPILQCISSKTNTKQSFCNKMTSSLSQLEVLLAYVDFIDWHLIIEMNHIDFNLTKQSNVNNKENLYCCPDHIVYAFGINKLLNCGHKIMRTFL